jgi:hypothetical protein
MESAVPGSDPEIRRRFSHVTTLAFETDISFAGWSDGRGTTADSGDA